MFPILTFLKLTSVVIGVLLFYASLSYETEGGKIQNLLEEWWIKVDDFKKQAISKHIAFIKALASLVTNIFDRVFGTRIYSVESLGISICYSDVCLGLLSILLSKLSPTTPFRVSDITSLIAFGILYGSLPILLRKIGRKFIRMAAIYVWCIALIIKGGWGTWSILFYAAYWWFTRPDLRDGSTVILVFAFAFVGAQILFWIFIGLMRSTVRTISQSAVPMKIIGLLLINLAPILFFAAVVYAAWKMPDVFGDIAIGFSLSLFVFALFGVVLNFSFILSSLLFVVLALTMLSHRLFWPAIDRPLYKLQALGIAKRPRIFAALGLVLIGFGWKAEWLKAIVEKLF
ncbi:MAG: hypothetical protein ACREBG_08170 [Pyrinomonadaceae bacterium]